MRKLFSLFTFTAVSMLAQSAGSIPFRAMLSPANEVPPVNITASGAATVWLHVVRDAEGRITSGSVDFDVDFQLPGATRITGLHIHRGAAGVNGPIVIESGVTGNAPVEVDAAGRGNILRQRQIGPADTAALEALNAIVQNPAGFYVNLHTTENPGGVIRGQMQLAHMVVLMGMMSPLNETPPITDVNASAVGSIIALITHDEMGRISSSQVIFDVNYSAFPEGTRFTGLHIHNGAAGVAGPVTISSGMQGGANAVEANPAGGNLRYKVEVPVSNAAALETLYGLMWNPEGFYINLHSIAHPGGIVRAQLRRTDPMRFSVNMSPANEVPPIAGLDASAAAQFTMHALRNTDGTIGAAVVVFNVNHRFPGAAQFTGLHIHNGAAGANAPVSIDSGLRAADNVRTETGAGNIYRFATINARDAVATLNSIATTPENHYLNLHTMTNPGGAVRAQLAGAARAPRAGIVVSAVSDPSLRTVAPGGLMTIFGTDLVRVEGDVSAFGGTSLPTSYNGTQVTIGGRPAPLVSVTATHIVAQVPVDTPAGNQTVRVRTGAGDSADLMVRVAPVAPAIFFNADGGIFIRNANSMLVGRGNAARAGDVLRVYATGLGTTTAPLQTGQITPITGTYSTSPVTVTVGGRAARVIESVATPGFVGLYQVSLEVPAGLSPGMTPVVIRSGDTASNSVMLLVE